MAVLNATQRGLRILSLIDNPDDAIAIAPIRAGKITAAFWDAYHDKSGKITRNGPAVPFDTRADKTVAPTNAEIGTLYVRVLRHFHIVIYEAHREAVKTADSALQTTRAEDVGLAEE